MKKSEPNLLDKVKRNSARALVILVLMNRWETMMCEIYLEKKMRNFLKHLMKMSRWKKLPLMIHRLIMILILMPVIHLFRPRIRS